MNLSPREKDKLLIFTAALLAERRRACGLKLNHPEAVALIVSQANGAAESCGLPKRLVAVKGNRTVTKRDMVHNADLPVMQIDAQTCQVRADDVLLNCEPATLLRLAQKYFLF